MEVHVEEVPLAPRPLCDFEPLLGAERYVEVESVCEAFVRRMKGRGFFTVTGQQIGGSIAENRRSLVQYGRGMGIDARWFVIDGPPEFYSIARTLRDVVRGALELEPGALGPEAREVYTRTLQANATELLALCRPGDVVLLHDPSTAGMIPPLAAAGVDVVWRCHHASDTPSRSTRAAWEFLAPDLPLARGWVFSDESLAPELCEPARTFLMPTTLDPFSVKNRDLGEAARRAILVQTGLFEPGASAGTPGFERSDGSPGRVEGEAEVLRLGRALRFEHPMVLQLGRWQRSKDAVGTLAGFAALLEGGYVDGLGLLIAGPDPQSPSEGPESRVVHEEVCEAWRALPHEVRDRVHVASLPMDDADETAAIVNALQAQAQVVVQKSLRESVGLAALEAMWKGKPVLASAVGGLAAHLRDGVEGVLLKDPTDRSAFAGALRELLDDPARAARLGAAAHKRVADCHLDTNALEAFGVIAERLGLGAASRR